MDFSLKGTKRKAPKEEPPQTQLAPKGYMTLAQVKEAFAPYKAQVNALVDQAKALEVKDEQSVQLAATLAGSMRKLSKALDALKIEKTSEARDFVSGVNGLAKLFTEPLESAVKTLKQKGETYSYQLIVEARKKAAEEQAARDALQKELNDKAAAANVEPVTLQEAAPRTGFDGVTRTESGSSLHVQMVWKGRIVDPAKIPREYCEPSQKLIDEAVKAGVREIQGCLIEEVPKSILRA